MSCCPKEWGYHNKNGTIPPNEWCSYFKQGNGLKQSPIDLPTTCTKASAKLEFLTTGTSETFLMKKSSKNYSWTAENTQTIALNGEKYDLDHFHMHLPSEHTIEGDLFDAEVHFVHKHQLSEQLLVIGVLLQETDQDNVWFNPLLTSLDDSSAAKLSNPYKSLLAKTFYHYDGSLTTPPCSEIVDWWVCTEPISLSHQQVRQLQSHFKTLEATDELGQNARPIQPVNDRTVSYTTIQ